MGPAWNDIRSLENARRDPSGDQAGCWWRRQTERINAAHREMGRAHHGRVRVGDWVITEIEWWGTVDGAALAAPDDRSYRYSGIGLLEIDDGKIARQILYADHRSLEEQLSLRARD
jgi:hypothetical protein